MLCSRLSEAQLDGLLSITEIRGSLIIIRYGRSQLSYLQNVEVVGSHSITLVNARTQLGELHASENVALVIADSQRLVGVDLSSLRLIVSGKLPSVG